MAISTSLQMNESNRGLSVHFRRRLSSLTKGYSYIYTPAMAYLRKVKQGKRVYFYIMRSERNGSQVSGKVLEYLGRDPEPKRLKRAMEYWEVVSKGVTRRRRK